jgi:hypothetical protein
MYDVRDIFVALSSKEKKKNRLTQVFRHVYDLCHRSCKWQYDFLSKCVFILSSDSQNIVMLKNLTIFFFILKRKKTFLTKTYRTGQR